MRILHMTHSPISCSDGMCGAEDCRRCRPETWNREWPKSYDLKDLDDDEMREIEQPLSAEVEWLSEQKNDMREGSELYNMTVKRMKLLCRIIGKIAKARLEAN